MKSFPIRLGNGIVIPTLNQVNKQAVINDKGIRLLNTTYKIYAKVLNERLKRHIKDKNVLPEIQTDFVKQKHNRQLQHMIEKETA